MPQAVREKQVNDPFNQKKNYLAMIDLACASIICQQLGFPYKV